MTGVAQKFWLVVIPSLTGFSSAGLLVLAALYSRKLFSISSAGYVATAAIALVSFGIIIWQAGVGGMTQSDTELPKS